jgi:hypothetical protein
LEDLAAIPDLMAGAVLDAMNCYEAEGTILSKKIIVPPPQSVASKTRELLAWFANGDGWPLHRLVYAFKAVPESTAILMSQVNLYGNRLVE